MKAAWTISGSAVLWDVKGVFVSLNLLTLVRPEGPAGTTCGLVSFPIRSSLALDCFCLPRLLDIVTLHQYMVELPCTCFIETFHPSNTWLA